MKTETDSIEPAVDRLVDSPITTSEADVLGFGQVAETFIDAIKAQPNNTSLTLGLDGIWGSGKSSILALIQKQIDSNAEAPGIGLIVVRFSPWLITNRTALVTGFFSQLSQALSKAEKQAPRTSNWLSARHGIRKKLATARKLLHNFSKWISIVSSALRYIDPTSISSTTAEGSKVVEKLTESKGKTLETLKEELTEALALVAKADPTFKILVLIDDLDRLDPDDALEILRLVKTVGNFPAIVYLLAYDKLALTKAIESSAGVDSGDAYLEKIIQFSFKVPPLEPFQLRNWLKQELNNLYPETINHSSNHATAVLDTWAGRLLTTPRDVKRLLFAIRAIWSKLEGRANLLDLIWLQIIALKASNKTSNLYSWLESYLQGLEAIAIGGIVTNKEIEQEKLVRLLSEMGWNEYRYETGKSRDIDFHHLDELLAGVTKNHLSSNDGDWIFKLEDDGLQSFRDEKRLSSPWHWRLYFALETPSHAVTDDEWLALVKAADQSADELTKALSQVLEFRSEQRRDTADQIIARASHQLINNTLNYPDRWLISITEQAKEMFDQSKPDYFLGSSRLFEFSIKAFANQVFRQLNDADRNRTIKIIFGNKSSIYPAASLIREQFLNSRKNSHEEEQEIYLSDSELEDAMAMQLKLYQALTPSDLETLKSPYDVLFAWKEMSNSDEGPKNLLQKAFKDDAHLLRTLPSFRYLSSSSQKGVPHIPESYLSPFVNTDELYKRLEVLASGKSKYKEEATRLLKLWWPAKK